jgi:general secretion pathway protein E/type IV pilus assembly protein PilB
MTENDARPPSAPAGPARGARGGFGLPSADLRAISPEADALALVPADFACAHRLLPLRVSGGHLVVAIADPLDTTGLDRLEARLSLGIDPVVADPEAIVDAIERCYGRTPAAGVPDRAVAPARAVSVGDDPVVREVQGILDEAVRRRASDIHLEPLGRRFRVRYRVDGVLTDGGDRPRERQAAIVSRLKIMADLSIAEKRLPQDGRLRGQLGGRLMDVRVSSLPTVHGESLVLRLLDREALRVDTADLGLLPDHRETLRNLLGLADGLVLVTGPTGSGKTTTLYSCLHALNGADRKIITVEDPVEYQLAGINQVPVRPEVGMTFAAALRAMLRQAPNVIMVGEIRDRETAEIALQAALTGHLVFSTLHTNDAAGAVSRLLDLGARPYLVAAALRAAIAQRLVRAICPECRTPHVLSEPETELVRRTGASPEGSWSRGVGCPACEGAGCRGRIGLFEFLAVTDATRQIICENAPPGRLRAHARSQGNRTLRQDGVRKAAAGLTTLAEVLAATVDDAD